MLDKMEYPRGCEPMWYFDRRLDVRLSVLCAAVPVILEVAKKVLTPLTETYIYEIYYSLISRIAQQVA